MTSYVPVDTLEKTEEALARVKAAQRIFSGYSQEKVDGIFLAGARAANRARIPLARLAAEETGMGVMEDKVIKNHFASERVFNHYRRTVTCGLAEEDKAQGWRKYYEPLGVVAAIIPTTNPTSTAIFKALLALKTRNGLMISPHPRAARSTIEAARVVLEAAVAAGAPEGIVGWIDKPALEISSLVLRECDVILATGGANMVKAAYSSGKPALGVGAGNVPALFDPTADVLLAVNSVILSKTFDNGMICASEQSVLIHEALYDRARAEFQRRGSWILSPGEKEALRAAMFVNGSLNARVVGQKAHRIAALAGFAVPESTPILIAEVESPEPEEEFAKEKLSPVLAMYRASDMDEAFRKAERMIEHGGYGHTAAIYADPLKAGDRLDEFIARAGTCRVVVNTPSAHGGIGDLFNFKLRPSLTLGCGSRGNNSVSENVGVEHLLNTKVVAERRDNMLWFRVPEKIYLKRGCLQTALEELKDVLGKKRAFVATDAFLYRSGMIRRITDKLDEMGLEREVFFDVEPDPTLSCAKRGAERMTLFQPDCVIAVGGGSAMDAAKIMWLIYESPESSFSDLAERFSDIRKRINRFPVLGRKAYFVAVPTTSGTGSEVTPFAVITDDESGLKHPLADYELLPRMAIIDPDLHMSAPKGLTANSGVDAVTHALEAYVSVMATEYTDALCLQALSLLFEYLPRAYERGAEDPEARERVANAATLAGMAFANAFLGVCHSMAHKLGAYHHLPHGLANALMIEEVVRFNASETTARQTAFSQYPRPRGLERYAEIADRLRLGGDSLKEKLERLLEAIALLKERVGIKETIADYVPNEADFLARLDSMSLDAFDDQCTGSNPRYPLIEEIKGMFLNAYYGKSRRKEI
ncbi:MAG: bifunctional acetaldehyde-CoA/alcohol dehydrogenase [Deltaproteobacteria bacterium]|jgi:acetaldehyde dehydrogenase/alcohol dehydrogenase|nr:bifunctional acetaldehyde-CoA/alcohol dehydrogenase [Deltaproteobacteria bacterium]